MVIGREVRFGMKKIVCHKNWIQRDTYFAYVALSDGASVERIYITAAEHAKLI